MIRDEAMSRRAIQRLMTQYHAAVDGAADEAVVELFARSGTLATSAGRWHGQREIRAGLLHRRSRPRAAGAGRRPLPLRRQIGSSEVVFVSPTEARGLSHFTAIGPHGIDHVGHYIDTFVRTSNGWRFASRDVLVDQQPASLAGRRREATGSGWPQRPRAAGARFA